MHYNSNNPNPMAKSITLELTVLSAEDLSLSRKPVAKSVFAVVRAESITSHTTSFKGNGNGAGFVSWNEKFLVDVAAHARCITFEVKCKTAMGSVKDVGVARIALSDFMGSVVPDHCLQFLSYRLRDWDGLKNGVINFSVKAAQPVAVVGGRGGSCGLQEVGAKSGSCSSNGVVTGIPVWWNSNTSNV